MSADTEQLWTLYKRYELYEAELLTFGQRVLLDFRRAGKRVGRVTYSTREDALKDAHHYRAGLERTGWSDRSQLRGR